MMVWIMKTVLPVTKTPRDIPPIIERELEVFTFANFYTD